MPKQAAPKVRTFVQKTILGVPVPFTTKEITKGFKRTKLFKPTTLKGMAKGLGRVGSKVPSIPSPGVFGAADLAWAMGSSMAASHRKSGKKTALQKVRASTHRAAKAGKPRYGSFHDAIEADKRSRGR